MESRLDHEHTRQTDTSITRGGQQEDGDDSYRGRTKEADREEDGTESGEQSFPFSPIKLGARMDDDEYR